MDASDEIILGIRQLALADAIKITQHAAQEMTAEAIRLDDILEAITNAQLLENYPTHRRGPCCLLYGRDTNNRDLHLVCTTANPVLIIITAYLPKLPKWFSPVLRKTP